MVSFYIAYTAPINPTSASPILTRAQVWAGLQRKIRHAEEFVPAIIGCAVLSEKGDEVIREVELKPGVGPAGKVREVCRSFEPSWVDFEQADGSTIKNVVSDGPGGELFMTYIFEWRHAELEAGSEEAKDVEEKRRKVGLTEFPAYLSYLFCSGFMQLLLRVNYVGRSLLLLNRGVLTR
jgi:hypothetical protein